MTLRSQSVGSWLLVALAPTALVVLLFLQLRVNNHLVFRFAVFFSTGILLSSLPLVAWRLSNGTLFIWLDSVFVQSVAFSWAEYFPAARLSLYPGLIIEALLERVTAISLLNAFYWLVLLFLPLILGIALYRSAREGWSEDIRPVAVIPLFHALSLLHHQLLIYLYFVGAFCLLGLLSVTASRAVGVQRSANVIAVYMVAVGSFWHLGHAAPKSEAHLLWGDRNEALITCPISRAGLRMTTVECDRYLKLIKLIDRHLGDDEALLSLPNIIEVNYLSGRKQAFLGHNCAMALRSDQDLQIAIDHLIAKPPRLIIIDPTNDYYSRRCRYLVDAIPQRYEAISAPAPFMIFRFRD